MKNFKWKLSVNISSFWKTFQHILLRYNEKIAEHFQFLCLPSCSSSQLPHLLWANLKGINDQQVRKALTFLSLHFPCLIVSLKNNILYTFCKTFILNSNALASYMCKEPLSRNYSSSWNNVLLLNRVVPTFSLSLSPCTVTKMAKTSRRAAKLIQTSGIRYKQDLHQLIMLLWFCFHNICVFSGHRGYLLNLHWKKNLHIGRSSLMYNYYRHFPINRSNWIVKLKTAQIFM